MSQLGAWTRHLWPWTWLASNPGRHLVSWVWLTFWPYQLDWCEPSSSYSLLLGLLGSPPPQTETWISPQRRLMVCDYLQFRQKVETCLFLIPRITPPPPQFVHMNLKQPGFPDTSLEGPDSIVMNGDPHPHKQKEVGQSAYPTRFHQCESNRNISFCSTSGLAEV